MSHVLDNIQFEGTVTLRISDGFETSGLNEAGSCSLRTFRMKSLSMDRQAQLLTFVVARRFPIMPKQQKEWLYSNGYEFDYEQIEITCNYCLAYNHIVSLDVRMDLNERIQMVSLSSPVFVWGGDVFL
ncbi:hypothetical protein [Photobacterium damselae]|uniref:hypothetical protein n=1 Tax=Photobacterium damselae TaxID=38293 RepID=UPI001EFDF408|nr:hypothetical protein [Photobacterium damselae]MCG9780641.1 hypothetical protein [Photobacterium damselae]